MADDTLLNEVSDEASEVLLDAAAADDATFADEATPASIDRSAASRSASGVAAEDVARAAAQAAFDKKAEDVIAIDLTEFSDVCDYFVIATGANARQVDTIVDEVEEKVAAAYGEHPFSIEGRDQRTWILMDYGSVVVHVFTPEARDYYRLEKLWGDAPTLTLTLS
ncbi:MULTISPECIES: ribosome silencing factor [Enorma]|uniref:ribosome silencing factor n=1 Tax=Enorma TaxID=1472762 RepID=UPI000348ABCB|nr:MULTISPECIES: ribosome silencing factor [Enorma]